MEVYRKEKLEPLLEQAINGEKVVFFVDAAHFVHRAYLGFLWCFTRTFICSPSGRKNFADFKAAISTCIGTANTERKEKLDSLLTLNFQSFTKVHVLAV